MADRERVEHDIAMVRGELRRSWHDLGVLSLSPTDRTREMASIDANQERLAELLTRLDGLRSFATL